MCCQVHSTIILCWLSLTLRTFITTGALESRNCRQFLHQSPHSTIASLQSAHVRRVRHRTTCTLLWKHTGPVCPALCLGRHLVDVLNDRVSTATATVLPKVACKRVVGRVDSIAGVEDTVRQENIVLDDVRVGTLIRVDPEAARAKGVVLLNVRRWVLGERVDGAEIRVRVTVAVDQVALDAVAHQRCGCRVLRLVLVETTVHVLRAAAGIVGAPAVADADTRVRGDVDVVVRDDRVLDVSEQNWHGRAEERRHVVEDVTRGLNLGVGHASVAWVVSIGTDASGGDTVAHNLGEVTIPDGNVVGT